MAFDKNSDKIAVTIPYFKLLASSDGVRRKNRFYNEPYIVSVAVDAQGKASPVLDFNMMPFPKVQAGQRVEMLGNGHLVYGPRNPGEFLALSVLESDADVRARAERLVQSKAVDLGFAEVSLQIIPLEASNGQGVAVRQLRLS